MTKDRRLGRGLAALLGNPVEGEDGFDSSSNAFSETSETSSSGSLPASGETVPTRASALARMRQEARDQLPEDSPSVTTMSIRTLELAVADLDPNPFQPRRQFNPEEIASLAESIKTHQQIQPILVRQVNGRYQLISGERRLRATIHAGLPTIRAEVREADDRLVSELAIIENLQRKDLNAIEKAMSFRRYLDEHKCTQEELAGRLSLDRSTIANVLRLLELPAAVVEMVQRGELTGGHAKPLLALGSEAAQIELAKMVMLESWSVRAVERKVSEMVQAEDEADGGLAGAVTRNKKRSVKDDQVVALEQQMKMGLGTKVEIQRTSRGRGRIVVHFTSLEEFDRLHSQFSGKSIGAKAA